MRKKLPIILPSERVVLSDVLPYETTLIFSNRYYYKYLLKRSKSIKNKKYQKRHNKAFKEIEDLLFSSGDKNKPFAFNINHKIEDFRELKIIHPKNQLMVVDFYEKYKSLIIYYCSLSPFSIRKPSSVAKFTFYNDLLHKKNSEGDLEHSAIEQEESEYENLKSYFTYQKYSNIHKFFESYQFHRSEKKYNKLKKIDIAKCFDSIYTHTISWAIFNKNIVKDNVDVSLETFAGKFDFLMQKLNENETNGIIIGPEFSRIFAEIIMQQIDRDLFFRLKERDINGNNLIHKIDYEIFRYVDDYFIFYNNDVDIDRIVKELKLSLSPYKLSVNAQKSQIYEKPIITEISLAKQKISDLFSDHLKLKEKENSVNEESNPKTTIYFSSNNVITRFKSIVKETSVQYKDIMNYSLAVLDRKVAKLIQKYKEEINNESFNSQQLKKQIEEGILEILDVSFFLYSVSPRVNSTIKLCLIMDKIINFLQKNRSNNYQESLSSNSKHNIFKKISDEINLVLKKNKTTKDTQIETLYLLIALGQLKREYRLSPAILSSYFNLSKENNVLCTTNELNYFSITVLLFYIKDIEIYSEIKECLKSHIKQRLSIVVEDKNWKRNTEILLLLLDCIACPFLDEKMLKKDQKEIIDKLEDFHSKIIEPISSLETYLKEIRSQLSMLYKCKALKILYKEKVQRIASSLELYSTELNKEQGWDVYKREEILVNAILDVKNNLKNSINKYAFKKDLLSLAGVRNYKAMIEQEKFWFTKWTEFDFRMELQAKRSQEVY